MDLRLAIKAIQVLNIDKDESTSCANGLVLNTKIKNESYIVSDADEELLILVSFKEIVDLKSIKIYALATNIENDEKSAPKDIDIFALKKLNVDFDDVALMKAHKSISCKPVKIAKGQNIKLQKNTKFPLKFKKIQHLAIHIKSNQNNTETTFINAIGLKGEIDNTLYLQSHSLESKNDDNKIRLIHRIKAETNYAEFEWTLDRKDFELFKKAQHSEVTFISDYHNISGCIMFFEMTPNGYSDSTNKHVNCTHIWLRLHLLPDQKKYAAVKYQWRCFADGGKISFFEKSNDVLSKDHYSLSTGKGVSFSDLKVLNVNELRFQCYVTIKELCVEQNALTAIKNNTQMKPLIVKLPALPACSGDIKNCDYIVQLKEIMQTYDTVMRTGAAFNNYSRAITANKAFHHSLFGHDTLKDFEYIFQSFPTECNIKHCNAFQRIYRNRNENAIINETVQCLDIIHCYYYHSIDIGYRLSSKEEREAKEINQTITIDIDEKEDVKHEHQVMYAANDHFKEIKDIVVPKKNCILNNSKRHQKFNQFQFGTPFIYEGKEGNVEPRYQSLKEELIQNEIKKLTVQQFNSEWKKAVNNFHSFLTTHREHTHKNNVSLPTNKDRCLPLILSLMVYCNYDSFQREFSRTYRDNNAKHEYFYHLAKNISNAVNNHGQELNFDQPNAESFYHGLNEPFLLPKIIGPYFGIQIFCPLSTSTSIEVAINFAERSKGIVINFGCPNIRLCNRSFKTRYFDVSWLSDFAYEKERLFVQMKSGIYVNDILNVKTGEQYRIILDALKIIDSVIMPYPKDWHTWKIETNKETKKQLILRLMEDKISRELEKADLASEYGHFQSLAVYARITAHSYFDNVKLIYLNHTAENCQFFTEFFLGNDKCKINLLPALFPNVEGITIQNITFTKEILDNVLTLFGGSTTETKLKYIILYPDGKNYKQQNDINEAIQAAKIGYGAKFNDIGYCLGEYDNVKAVSISLKSIKLPSINSAAAQNIYMGKKGSFLINLN